MDSGDTGQIRWGALRRLEFIDFRLFWSRRVNRADLARSFGISAQQASADIAAYESLAPANLAYDRANKAYVRTPAFTPVLIGSSIERYLMQLVAIRSEAIRPEQTWFGELPTFEMVVLGRKPVDPSLLMGVVDAIRDGLLLEVRYASISGSPDEDRSIAPHALSHNAGKWYVRAWAAEHNEFRDYSLTRILGIRSSSKSPVDPALDYEWAHMVDLVLTPNPDLPKEQQLAIAAEYRMTNDRLIVPVRLSLCFYLISQYNLDVPKGVLKPEKQYLVLTNSDEVDAARNAARHLAKMALSRVMQ